MKRTRLRIAEVAQSKGVKQFHLQKGTGMHGTIINRYWHGTLRSVDLAVLDRIARELGVSTFDLMEQVEEDEAESGDTNSAA